MRPSNPYLPSEPAFTHKDAQKALRVSKSSFELLCFFVAKDVCGPTLSGTGLRKLGEVGVKGFVYKTYAAR